MRAFILILLSSIFLSNCTQIDECKNRFDFISTNDSIPILTLNYAETSESRLQRMNDLYTIDLCGKCSWVEFKSPFEMEGKSGYFKILADFDSPYCSNCPMAMRLRYYFQILINSNNQIFVEGEPSTIDSLETNISNYLSQIGHNVYFPETFKQLNYSIQWDSGSDSTFIDSVFSSLFSAHTDFVQKKVSENGIDFCSIPSTELAKLKSKYPIRIVIPGKPLILPNPSQMKEMLKEIEAK